MPFSLSYVFVKGFRASSRLIIKTHFIHLCIFIYKDRVLTSTFCLTSLFTDTNLSS